MQWHMAWTEKCAPRELNAPADRALFNLSSVIAASNTTRSFSSQCLALQGKLWEHHRSILFAVAFRPASIDPQIPIPCVAPSSRRRSETWHNPVLALVRHSHSFVELRRWRP